MERSKGASHDSGVSRRRLLAISGGALAFPVGTARANTPGGSSDASGWERRCPEATLRPSMGHCEGASSEGCADDHPETVALRGSVEETLAERYPNVGSLIDDGFLPYFDTLDRDEDGWSHWLHPEHIGDDSILDPERPEAVLVDNDRWLAIGVMFVATRNDEPIEPPPPLYEDDESDGPCTPWHYHAGLPGRFAWWYYEQVYAEGGGTDVDEGGGSWRLPCRTPCMLHVWTVPHPDGVHAHDGPPAEYRDGPTAAEAGFDTDAEPGADRLGWDALPDEVVPDALPEELRRT